MRICLVYDCLFPYTVGGAERWYRNLGERLGADGHEVTYLTLRQWDRDRQADVPGVRVIAVGPRMSLYAGRGRRRIVPPIVFGFGVLWHLARRRGRYDVVHSASFPYFSLLAAGLVRPWGRFRLVVDWHEVWTRDYWREYLGPVGGPIGALIQLLCTRIPQHAFCFSDLHAARLSADGLRGSVTKLPGEYEGPRDAVANLHASTCIVFAGRHIPEKQVLTIPAAVREARRHEPGLRALILGDGPERPRLLAEVEEMGLEEVIDAPGFVESDRVREALATALCLLLPSRREGYGMVVIEAAMHGTPSIVVTGADNAAVELIEDGINGVIAPSASPSDLAAAIARVRTGGRALRASTAEWFTSNSERLALSSSLGMVLKAYARGDTTPSPRSSR